MGRLGCTHLTVRAGPRWVRTAQGRPAPRRSMWPSRCWVGSFIVRAGGRECWLAAAAVVVVVCWLGELGRRSTTAEGLGALSRPVAWRIGEQPVAGCRSTCSDSRHFPALNVPFRTWSGPPPTPAILATLFLYAFPPSSADGPAGVLDIFVTHTASQQSREHTYNLLFPHVSWGPAREEGPEGIDAMSLCSGPVQRTCLAVYYY